MKIKESKLREIVQEEIQNVLTEQETSMTPRFLNKVAEYVEEFGRSVQEARFEPDSGDFGEPMIYVFVGRDEAAPSGSTAEEFEVFLNETGRGEVEGQIYYKHSGTVGDSFTVSKDPQRVADAIVKSIERLV